MPNLPRHNKVAILGIFAVSWPSSRFNPDHIATIYYAIAVHCESQLAEYIEARRAQCGSCSTLDGHDRRTEELKHYSTVRTCT